MLHLPHLSLDTIIHTFMQSVVVCRLATYTDHYDAAASCWAFLTYPRHYHQHFTTRTFVYNACCTIQYYTIYRGWPTSYPGHFYAATCTAHQFVQCIIHFVLYSTLHVLQYTEASHLSWPLLCCGLHSGTQRWEPASSIPCPAAPSSNKSVKQQQQKN